MNILIFVIAYSLVILIFLTFASRVLFFLKKDIDPLKAITPDVAKLLEIFNKEKKEKEQNDYLNNKRGLA